MMDWGITLWLIAGFIGSVFVLKRLVSEEGALLVWHLLFGLMLTAFGFVALLIGILATVPEGFFGREIWRRK